MSPINFRSKVLWAGLLAAIVIIYFLFLRPPAQLVAKPVRGPAVQAVYATGVVEPVIGARISPLVSGTLLKLLSDERQEVSAGQALAQLDDSEVRAEIASLEATRKTQNHDFERSEALYKRNVVSPQEYEHAKRSLEETSAKIESVKARLGYYTLRSPLAGKVLRRDGEPGEMISTGSSVFWVGKEKPLRISADVDEENIPFVKVGQKVLIRTDAWPKESFPGTVSEITPRGDIIFKTYRVRVALPDDSPLMIAMSTEVNIVTGESTNALLVPSSALNDGQLWTIDDGQLHQLSVDTGAKGDDFTEVKSPLPEDTLVVVKPDTKFREGQRARPIIAGK